MNVIRRVQVEREVENAVFGFNFSMRLTANSYHRRPNLVISKSHGDSSISIPYDNIPDIIESMTNIYDRWNQEFLIEVEQEK